MSLVALSKVNKAFGAQDVLREVSFTLGVGQKAGLVGENGSGKSTILKLIAAELQPDRGTVTLKSGVRIHYVPQLPTLKAGHTALHEVLSARPALFKLKQQLELAELGMKRPGSLPNPASAYATVVADYSALGGYQFEQEAQRALQALGLDEMQQQLPLASLSGGEQARVALATALLAQPDLLLLDEPDNHLDLEGIRWLEDALAHFDGALILITHDRDLLEHVAEMIIEVEDGDVRFEHGKLSSYFARKRERIERQKQEYLEQQRRVEKLKADIRRTEQRAQRFDRRSINDHWRRIGKKIAKTAVVRKRRLEKELADAQRVERPRERSRIELRLETAMRSGHVLLAEDVCMRWGSRLLLDQISLELTRGERIALTGRNGCGKTTLLDIIAGRQEADAGEVWLAKSAPLFYCDQHQAGLDPALTVYELLARETNLTPNQIYYLLARLLMKGMGDKRVDSLSGGERSRLVLALLMNTPAELLLLDEPSNHLDLPSIEVLEEALADFGGAVLLVSHDRRLVQNAATRVLALRDGTLETVS